MSISRGREYEGIPGANAARVGCAWYVKVIVKRQCGWNSEQEGML